MTKEEQAQRIVNLIVADIDSRAGIGNEWDQIDKETREEIQSEWRDMVLEVIS